MSFLYEYVEVVERDLRYLEHNAGIHQAMENPGERLGIGAGADNNQIIETSLISRACGYLKQGIKFAGSCAKKVVDKAADLVRCAKDFVSLNSYTTSLVLGSICAGIGVYCYGPTITQILAPMLSITKTAITDGISNLSTTFAKVARNLISQTLNLYFRKQNTFPSVFTKSQIFRYTIKNPTDIQLSENHRERKSNVMGQQKPHGLFSAT